MAVSPGGFKGIDVRQTGSEIVLRAFLQTPAGGLVSSGSVNFYLIELQSDGSIKTYDFNDNTFKATAVTTESLAATYRKSNNGTTDTGLWTAVISTLTGFTIGAIYEVRVNCAGASPSDQMREFQYGGEQSDLVVTQGALGVGYLQDDVTRWLTGTPDGLSSGKVPGDVKLWLASAPNALQSGRVDAYIGALGTAVITAASIAAGALNGKGDWATAGAQMDLINAPNATAITAINSAVLTAVNNINNLSALANLFAPSVLVRPPSGSVAYPFTFVVKDVEGHAVDVDGNSVTLTAKNAAGVDRSANLSAVTHTGTGEYTFTYTVHSTDADEGLAVTASGTVQSATRKAWANGDIADADNLTALAAIQAQTDKIGTTAADSSNITEIFADVDELIATIGVAGAGLTGLPGVTLLASAFDAVLIESGISAGPGLTDDSGSQLTSINARQALALVLSGIAGVLANADTNPTTKPAGKPVGNTRLAVTADSFDNRTAVTIKVPT